MPEAGAQDVAYPAAGLFAFRRDGAIVAAGGQADRARGEDAVRHFLDRDVEIDRAGGDGAFRHAPIFRA